MELTFDSRRHRRSRGPPLVGNGQVAHPVQPGEGFGPRRDLVDSTPDDEEDFPHDVVGLLGSDSTTTVKPHRGPVLAIDLCEPRMIEAAQWSHEVFIVDSHMSGKADQVTVFPEHRLSPSFSSRHNYTEQRGLHRRTRVCHLELHGNAKRRRALDRSASLTSHAAQKCAEGDLSATRPVLISVLKAIIVGIFISPSLRWRTSGPRQTCGTIHT